MGDTWSITANAYTELCNAFAMVDSLLPLSLLDLVFITTNSATAIDWKGNPRNPERGLIRFQFMESLVRLAEEKYFKTKQCKTHLEAVRLLLESIIRAADDYDPHRWRTGRYFC